MISVIIALIVSISHKISNIFYGTKDSNANKKIVMAKYKPSLPPKNAYVQSSSNNIVLIKPHGVMESNSTGLSTGQIESSHIMVIKPQNIKESNYSHLSNNGISVKNIESVPKSNVNDFAVEPGNLSEYDDYAKSINDLNHQIEINRLQREVYRSQINYEDPGSYDNATMIGVVVDKGGYMSAKVKLIDDTVTDLEIGSRFGHYIVSTIDINEIVLISTHCKRFKAHKSKYNKRNLLSTDTENVDKTDSMCKPVKIYPVYRDINNKLPGNNNTNTKDTHAATNVGGSVVHGGGTSISTGGMTLSIPPIETASHGN